MPNYTAAQRAAYGRKMASMRANSSAPVFGGIYGRGAYKSRRPAAPKRRPAPRRARPAKPRNQPSSVLGQIGSSLGGAAGSLLSKVLGLGDYKFQRNSLLDSGKSSNEVPVMHSAKDGVRIRHREFIANVNSAIAFSNTTYNVNPGLSGTFPWLSAIAENFEEYRFEGLLFDYVSTSSDALTSTNTALGTIVMAAEYNAAAPAYVNKQQMENSMWAVSAKPSSCQLMPVECAPHLNPLANQYIRTGAVPSGQDQRLFDLCNVQVAAVGSQAAAVVGELWCTYDVVLLKPQLQSGLNLNGQSAHYQLNSVAVTTAYFGTSQTVKYDSMGLTFSGGTVCTFPLGAQGNYLIGYNVVGSSVTISSPTFGLTNCSGVNVYSASSSPGFDNNGTASNLYLRNLVINIPDPTKQAIITVSSGTIPTSASSADLIVTQLNGNLNS